MAGSSVNTATSMLGAKTLITFILNELLNKLEAWSPDLAFVKDENLSYETALPKYRSDNSLQASEDVPLPLFAFRRTVLRYTEGEKGIGRRNLNLKARLTKPDNSIEIYNVLHCEFDVPFNYYTRNIEDLERFELTYLSQRSLSDNKKLTVDFENIGLWDFFLEFGQLDDKIINIEDSYYKALVGQFTVRGYFFTFKEVGKRINIITAKIKDKDTNLQHQTTNITDSSTTITEP